MERVCKLFCAVICKKDYVEIAKEELQKEFGEIQFESEIFNFSDYTDYYEDEMGKPLQKFWISFKGLFKMDANSLISYKKRAEKIEDKYRENGKRKINIDPGIITLSKLMLTTHKNYSHRVYLGNDVFVEITLIFEKGTFCPLRWTYKDYIDHIPVFNKMREIFRKELREEGVKSEYGI